MKLWDVIRKRVAHFRRSVQERTSRMTVFFFIPNLIGYLRLLLVVVSMFVWKSYPKIFIGCYTSSFFLDGLDGAAARKFNQVSRFGAVLDMLSDRCSTAALVHILTFLYPYQWFIGMGLFLNALDTISHWSAMYSSLYGGMESHRSLTTDKNFILRLYYESKIFMGLLCVGNELSYLYLYLHYFFPNELKLVPWYVVFLFPLWFGKQVVNFIQLGSSLLEIVLLEAIYKNEEEKKLKEKK